LSKSMSTRSGGPLDDTVPTRAGQRMRHLGNV
jgi:hypothetical protein